MSFYHPRRERDQLLLTARGLIAENGSAFINPSGFAPTSQIMYVSLIGVRAGDVITNIVLNVQVAAVGTDPTLVKAGLYTTAGTRLAQTANLAADTMFDTVGYKQMPLSSTYTVTTDGGLYVAFLKDGAWASTDVQLTTIANNAATTGAIGSGPSVSRHHNALVTDLPASATWDPDSRNIWAGLS
jgi:hypothetical protein